MCDFSFSPLLLYSQNSPSETHSISEWGLLVFIPFVILLVIVIKGHIYMPVWTYFIALGFGAAAMLPLSAIYAISVSSSLRQPFRRTGLGD